MCLDSKAVTSMYSFRQLETKALAGTCAWQGLRDLEDCNASCLATRSGRLHGACLQRDNPIPAGVYLIQYQRVYISARDNPIPAEMLPLKRRTVPMGQSQTSGAFETGETQMYTGYMPITTVTAPVDGPADEALKRLEPDPCEDVCGCVLHLTLLAVWCQRSWALAPHPRHCYRR